MNINNTQNQLNLMQNTKNIRNISVIAHVDHGKSTLTDALLARSGIINEKQAGNLRCTDGMKEEQERGITIKSTGVSMVYESEHICGCGNICVQKNICVCGSVQKVSKGNCYMFNLIDSPGHLDFSSEVTAALRVSDGALVIIDAVEGVCVQTETVLRQACSEKVKSCLVINKLDRQILELQADGETIYQDCVRNIDKVNVILSTYQCDELMNYQVDPVMGNVAFAAGKECWGFTLDQIAEELGQKLKINSQALKQKLWGDNFYDHESKKWLKQNQNESGKTLKRGFVEFVIEPIIKLHYQIMKSQNLDAVYKKAEQLNIRIGEELKNEKPKILLKHIMSKWLNAGDAIFNMMIKHLPSPVEALKYRTSVLYDGDLSDETAICMQNSDPNGPLIMYISKMVPNNNYTKFFAFGRVFGGTLKAGQKIRILGPNYNRQTKEDLYLKTISNPIIMMGNKQIQVDSVPAGNTCALQGIDDFIIKTGSIVELENSYPIKTMKYSVSPVVKVAVSPKNSADLPRLIQGLQKLTKSDNIVQYEINKDTGEITVAGSGQLHLEVCLNLLKQEFAKCEIITSEPLITYKETILKKSEQGLSKSSNGHNRLWGTVEPIDLDLCTSIENKALDFQKSQNDKKYQLEFVNQFQENYGWEREHVKKIWTFGPENGDANILVDTCHQVQEMNCIKDSIVQAFKWTTREGVLTGEKTRGIRVNLQDAKIHSDNAHRGTGEILPMARSLIYGNCLNAQPSLMEPVFLSEIDVPIEYKNQVYQIFNQNLGEIFEEEVVSNTPFCKLKGYIPVEKTFGLVEVIRKNTKGQAFPSFIFSHYQTLSGNVDNPNSKVRKVVDQIRKRKGYPEQIPTSDYYLKKL